MEITSINGGICAPRGISACGIAAGFRKEPGRLDMALVAADSTCTAAGVFTSNRFCAAPVQVSREHVANGQARAIVINSGNANAATGERGIKTAEDTATIVAKALGCAAEDVLVASTGVIGVPLDTDHFITGVPKAVAALSATGGGDAARAIMTTDTHPKEAAREFVFEGITYRVGGMVKGSGMIMPNMATMIAVITADAPLDPACAHDLLKRCADRSFNRVTVDSDTSTNDTCILLATGAAGGNVAAEGTGLLAVLEEAMLKVCVELAKKIAADGEGATKLVEVTVTGAATEQDADTVARTIANSPLVKTAIAGHDANWGRIAAAAGRSGVAFSQEDVDIAIMGMPVCAKGLTVPFDEEEALRRFQEPCVPIEVDLGMGTCSSTIWTCDLTHDYITINGDYRT